MCSGIGRERLHPIACKCEKYKIREWLVLTNAHVTVCFSVVWLLSDRVVRRGAGLL